MLWVTFYKKVGGKVAIKNFHTLMKFPERKVTNVERWWGGGCWIDRRTGGWGVGGGQGVPTFIWRALILCWLELLSVALKFAAVAGSLELRTLFSPQLKTFQWKSTSYLLIFKCFVNGFTYVISIIVSVVHVIII